MYETLVNEALTTGQVKRFDSISHSHHKAALCSERSDPTTSEHPTSPATAARLISLLSRLPTELRLNIYEMCIPCLWHRKRRVRLDYLGDCKWMATSPLIFGEAAPLVLAKSIPYTYTSLAEGETLAGIFQRHIEEAFPKDCSWVLPIAREIVENVAVTVRCPFFYRNNEREDLSTRFLAYFKNIDSFPNLSKLYVSLAPDHLPANIGGPWQSPDDWNGAIEPEIRSKLELTALGLKGVIPYWYEVVWRFDRAAMPSAPLYLRGKRDEVMLYLEGISETLGEAWKRDSGEMGLGKMRVHCVPPG